MKKTIVTGGTGFVGANLARKLLQEGHQVNLLVRSQHAGWRIADIRSECQIHEVDLQDHERLSGVVSHIKPDWIFHLAANGAYSWQTDVREIVDTNLSGTLNLLQSCIAVGFESFINTGSSSEYGFKDHAPDESEYIEPNSYYAIAKSSATMFCRHFARTHKLNIPTLRLYSVYGPFEEPNRLMPTIIINGLNKRLPPLVDPTIARDYVSTDDVMSAYLLAAGSSTQEYGAVFNVGSGTQVTLAEVVATACKVLQIKDEPNWGSMPNRTWDTSVWVAKNDKIKTELKWHIQDDFEQGFIKMVDWLRTNKEMREFYEQRIQPAAV